jgi:transposase
MRHLWPALYNNNMVERLWARLKEWRAVATRYEKTASCFMGALHLAAACDWLKYRPYSKSQGQRYPTG